MEMGSSHIYLNLASLVCFLSFGISTVKADGAGWNYNSSSHGGPEHWHELYADCGGMMQSPIDIIKDEAIYSPTTPYFDLSDYALTKGVRMTLTNMGGHTVEVDYAGNPIVLKAGGLPDNYKLIQFHFHWGDKDDVGSEHFLDGQHFPMELHLVHHQSKLDNVTVAVQHPFGLAVLGFFFEVSLKNNTKFDALLEHFNKILSPNDKTEIETFPLIDLLPGNTDKLDFYRYYGSLTTPPCYETVIWSLATEYIPISEYQLNMFRNLYNEDHEHLINDFRPTQPLHARSVITTKKPMPSLGSITSTNSAASYPVFHSITSIIFFIFCCCFF